MRRASFFSQAAAVGVILALAGCATPRHGITRQGYVRDRPSLATVQLAMRDAPGVELAGYRWVEPTRGYGVVNYRNARLDRYLLRDRASGAEVILEVGGNDREGLRARFLRAWGEGESGTPERLAATRSLMDRAYAALRGRLPQLPPAERLREDVF